MFFKIFRFFKIFQFTKHCVLCHMMTIDDIVYIRKIFLIIAVKKNTSSKRKLSLNIRIHILRIIFCLN